MTLDEFKKELELSISINVERLESEQQKGNCINTSYYKGKISTYEEVSRIVELVGERNTPHQKELLIEVTFQFYSILLEELRVRKRTFKSLEEYTAWVRHVSVKESDIQIINVCYIDKEVLN